jgi:hypothetical protein
MMTIRGVCSPLSLAWDVSVFFAHELGVCLSFVIQ